MSLKQKIQFIINPVAGSGVVRPYQKNISELFPENKYHVAISYTQYRNHAAELAAKAIHEEFDVVVAAGGDGTINEAAKILAGSQVALGILPCGSGNGLARHHGIPMNLKQGLEVIKRMKTTQHDAAKINGVLSFNVSGIGFDAHIAHLFGKDGKRGFGEYVRLTFREFNNYQDTLFTIDDGTGRYQVQAAMVSIATGSQFGNNAYIAPDANTSDGKTNITSIRKMKLWELPFTGWRIFNKTILKSQYAKSYTAPAFKVGCPEPQPLHIDGEPTGFTNEFFIQTVPGLLKLIVP